MTTELYLGGRVYSPVAPQATALAVSDGVVVWIGDDAVGRALHPGARVHDLDGRFLAPGFVDPHVHLTDTGIALTGLNLAGLGRAEALAAVGAAATGTDGRPGGAVLWGGGWDASVWPGGPPTTAELDAVAAGRPVYLARIDEHSAVASTALRVLAPELPTLPGHHPDGPLTGAAHHRVRALATASLSAADRRRLQLAALDEAARYGIVAVHENGGPQISGTADFRGIAALDHPVAVRRYWGQAVADVAEAHAVLAETGADALGGDLFIDGSLGSHTAALTGPYTDAPGTCGHRHLADETVAAHLTACTRAGIQAGFHAIGDAAIAAVAAGLAKAAAELGGPAVAALGHRVEHCELAAPEAVETLARYGAIASVQPLFDAFWGGPDAMYAARLGERAAALNDFAALARAGVTLAIGSDSPVTPLRPWQAIRGAVHHRTPGRGVSPRAAFAAATRGAWRAGGVRDGIAGTLVPGAPATFAVWDVDELTTATPSSAVQRWSTDPRSRTPALPVLDPGAPLPECVFSVRDGVTVYRAAAAAGSLDV